MWVGLLASAAIISGAAACGQTGPDQGPVGAVSEMAYAGADMDGKALTLAQGQILRIELESIPTAGYVWTITDQPDFLELVGDGQRPTNPDVQNQPGFTGGNHFLSFDLKATAPGYATLHLIEARPWETDTPPIGTYSLAVTVEPSS